MKKIILEEIENMKYLLRYKRGVVISEQEETNDLIDKYSSKSVRELFSNYYKNSKFVTLLPAGSMPMTSAVLGSNNVQIQVAVDEHVGRVVISTAIDNLGKGAAGQAIQNANLMCDLAEDLGLQNLGVR